MISEAEFKGHVYLRFKNSEQADLFSREKHYFYGKLLICDSLKGYRTYIKDCLEIMRKPYSIFATNIPKFLKKVDIENIFNKFGKINSVKIINSQKKKGLCAYINYDDSTNAKNCFEGKFFQEKCLKKIELFYSIPKFSEETLDGFHPQVQNYLIKVQNKEVSFDPDLFIMIEQEVLLQKLIKKNMKNSKKTGINNSNQILNIIQTNIYSINNLQSGESPCFGMNPNNAENTSNIFQNDIFFKNLTPSNQNGMYFLTSTENDNNLQQNNSKSFLKTSKNSLHKVNSRNSVTTETSSSKQKSFLGDIKNHKKTHNFTNNFFFQKIEPYYWHDSTQNSHNKKVNNDDTFCRQISESQFQQNVNTPNHININKVIQKDRTKSKVIYHSDDNFRSYTQNNTITLKNPNCVSKKLNVSKNNYNE